ncbi:MAG TPA: glycosyltransferase family 87 protein [Anaerolineales bacterium]|nr:glycosyltransferase family 87 protein [Anaerolineales bacterium]
MTARTDRRTAWIARLDFRVVGIALILILYAFVWKDFANFIHAIDHCPLAFCDFQQFYYPAGAAVLRQAALPVGFYYSSFAAVLFAPFALLPLSGALVVWGTVQVLAALALYLLPGRSLLKDKASRFVYTVLFFTSAAVLNNFKWGQISTLIVLGVFAAFLLYENGKRYWSAALLGAIVALKFFPAVFLLVFLFKKDWRYLLACAASAAACLLAVPAAAMGPARAFQLQVASGSSVTRMVSSVALVNTDTQYFASVLTRYFKIPVGSPAFLGLTILGYLVTLFVVYLAYRVVRSGRPDGPVWAACLLWMTVPFWIPSAWPHYFAFLPLAQALVFQALVQAGQPVRRGPFLLWLLSGLLASILAELALRDWFSFAWLGLILWGNLAALGLAWSVLRKMLQPAPQSA